MVQGRGRLIFVEVKTRRSESFGRPATAINAVKRKILRRAARRYLARLQTKPSYYRFDVIEVIGFPHAKEPPVVRHIENAFPIEGGSAGASDPGIPGLTPYCPARSNGGHIHKSIFLQPDFTPERMSRAA